jgi:leucyl-tRNA synthetase
LDHHPTWKHTTCPQCGKKAERETDTLDTFVDSSWYWLRVCCPAADVPLDSSKVNLWNPVDWYIGGPEHAVMHLLYARFFVKVLRDLGYVNFDEPFTHLLTQGMVCHKTYKDADDRWLYPEEVETAKQPVTIGRSEKMSKSKKNTVDPQEILDKYGADTTRLFVVSDTPPDKDLDWSDEGLDGCWRYTNRIHRIAEALWSSSSRKRGSISKSDIGSSSVNSKHLIFDEVNGPSVASCALAENDNIVFLGIVHKYLQLITQDYEQHAFNKVIAHHRELGNAIEKHCSENPGDVCEEIRQIYVLTIAPIMPHLAAELWQQDDATWPVFNPHYLAEQKNTIVVQVNGKKRAVFEVDQNISEQDLVSQAKQLAAQYLTGEIRKTIVVPGRMVSFVT